MIWNEIGWSIIVLIITICLYCYIVFQKNDPFIGLTAIWIYTTIYAKSEIPAIKTVC